MNCETINSHLCPQIVSLCSFQCTIGCKHMLNTCVYYINTNTIVIMTNQTIVNLKCTETTYGFENHADCNKVYMKMYIIFDVV